MYVDTYIMSICVIRYDAIIIKKKKEKYKNYFRVIATLKTDLKEIELLYS